MCTFIHKTKIKNLCKTLIFSLVTQFKLSLIQEYIFFTPFDIENGSCQKKILHIFNIMYWKLLPNPNNNYSASHYFFHVWFHISMCHFLSYRKITSSQSRFFIWMLNHRTHTHKHTPCIYFTNVRRNQLSDSYGKVSIWHSLYSERYRFQPISIVINQIL